MTSYETGELLKTPLSNNTSCSQLSKSAENLVEKHNPVYMKFRT